MNRKLTTGTMILLAGVFLAGCTQMIGTGSKIEKGPVGIGRSVNQLKGSPCACTEIPMVVPGYAQI